MSSALRGLARALFGLVLALGCLAVAMALLLYTRTANAADFDWSDCFVRVIPATPATPGETITHRLSVFFDFDGDAVRPDDLSRIRDFVRTVAPLPGMVELSAYTDRRGPDAYNDALGERRLRAVASVLVAEGLAEARLQGTNRGERDAVIDEALDDAGRQPDRRADAVVIEVRTGTPGTPERREALDVVSLRMFERYPPVTVHASARWLFVF